MNFLALVLRIFIVMMSVTSCFATRSGNTSPVKNYFNHLEKEVKPIGFTFDFAVRSGDVFSVDLPDCFCGVNNTINSDNAIVIHVNEFKFGALGALIAPSISIKSNKFESGGKLEGNNIVIEATSFKYTGVITCNTLCVIKTSTPIDHKDINFKGTGILHIIIRPVTS